MLVTQAYRFALDPTPAQERALRSHCGARRFAYNWGLALVKERLELRERVRRAAPAEQLADGEVEALARTVAVPWMLPALRREWNRAKAQAVPWWAQNSKESYSAGLADLAKGLDAFSKSKRGMRKGRARGLPVLQGPPPQAAVLPVHHRAPGRVGALPGAAPSYRPCPHP